jgi:hypothetical protein
VKLGQGLSLGAGFGLWKHPQVLGTRKEEAQKHVINSRYLATGDKPARASSPPDMLSCKSKASHTEPAEGYLMLSGS